MCAKEVADARLAETAPASDDAGLIDGRYRILSQLGRGASKVVYLALDLRLDREVALAIVPTAVRGSAVRERLHREAKMMARLGDHPHIVTIFDLSEADTPYVVARYMAGGSLADRLAAGSIDMTAAVTIAGEVLDGLAHAHARGIVHRDVKPNNIWLDAGGHAALGDFGIALAPDEIRLTAEGGLIGTALYLAPEQAHGEHVDGRADLYSLGATLYEMLCGRPPFTGPSSMAVIAQHISATPEPPAAHNPAVPPELEQLVLALLAKAPDDRPASAEEARAALATAAGGAAMVREPPPPAARTEDFVGRASELAQLETHLTAVGFGRSRLVVLSGEPGIGKSRLAGELMQTARGRGMRVLYGGGYEDGTLSYQPFVEALRDFVLADVGRLRAAGLDAELSELGRLMPAAQLGELPKEHQGDSDLQRFRLFQAVAAVVAEAARDRAVLLVLDDLQWADAPTLQMLRHLVRGTRLRQTLLLAVHRADGAGALVTSLRREREVHHIALAGLSRGETEDFVGERLPQARPTLVRRLFDDTEGNPLFLGEVVRSLDEAGPLDGSELEEMTLPESIKEVLAQRLRRLGDDTVEALRTAAVVGREFSLDVLAPVLGWPPTRALDALDEAVAAGLLTETTKVTERYEFSHALLRTTLLEGQRAGRRRRLHLDIARALEEAGDAHPAELALHYWHARHVGGADRAVTHLYEAGRLADEALAWEDAERHYRRGLLACDVADANWIVRARLLLALGDALEFTGNPVGAKDTFATAAELARSVGDAALLARAALGYGRAPGQSTHADAQLLALLEEARAGLKPAQCELRARVLGRLAVERSSMRGTEAEVDALSREAVELAERCDDDVVLAIALASRHWTLSGPDTLDERCAVARQSLELAVRAGDRERELSGRAWWLFDLLELGDLPGVEEQLSAYEALAESLRHPSYRGYALAMRGMLALLRGDHADAAVRIEDANRLLRRAEDPDAIRVRALQRFVLHHQQGQFDDAAGAVASMPGSRPVWAALAAWARAEQGDLDATTAELPAVEAVPYDGEWSVTMVALGHALARIGDAARGARVRELLDPFAERLASIEGIVCLGPVAHPLADLAGLLGDEREAERLRALALDIDARIGRNLDQTERRR